MKRNRHAIKTIEKTQVLLEAVCVQRGCKFNGKRAAQGICFPAQHKLFPERYVMALHKSATESAGFYLMHVKEKPLADKFKRMRELYITATMNWMSCLDELVSLRIENATLRNELGRWK